MKTHKLLATLAPASWDEETQTVDAVLSTGAGVKRRDAAGPYIEFLDIDASTVANLPPLLNSHRTGDVMADLFGRVIDVRKENGALIGKLHIDRPDVAARVRSGVIRDVSIGYQHTDAIDGVDPKTRVRTKRARVHVTEASLVIQSADLGAHVRKEPTMTKKVAGAANPAPEGNDALENENVEAQTITRNAAIRTLGRQNNLPQEFIDGLIDGEGDVIAARAAINAELIRTSQAQSHIRAHVGFSNEDPSVIRERRTEARFVRDNGGTLSEAARPYVHESLLDWAKDSLRRSGVSTLGLSPDDIFQRAATHGVSDFPEHLSGVGRRVALAAYTAQGAPIKQVARSTTVADFRNKQNLRASGVGLLEEVGEFGEIRGTTRYETVEGYAARTFARMIGVSRKALMNDDLGMWNNMAQLFGTAAAQTEAAELVALLESNADLDDSTPVFDAARGNYEAGGSIIGIDSIGDARLSMRKLTDEDGTLISVGPKFLLVSAELETAAQQFVASYQPQAFSETNPFSNLTVLVEPRLAPFSWYLFADPASAPVLEYAHLAGANGPVVESRPAWNTLGLETRAYLDFGAGFVGWKGAFKFESGEDSNSVIG